MHQLDHSETDGKPHYPRALEPSTSVGLPVASHRDRVNADSDIRRTSSGSIRAIIVIVLVLLVAMLAYLLSLSSKPSVTDLKPAPGSTTDPGTVLVEARVVAAKPIQRVTLTIDGVVQVPAVVTEGDRSWVVRLESILPQGTHQASVDVRDASGKVQHESWSFSAAGPRVAPTISFSDPPSGATVAQGLVRLGAQISSDSAIDSLSLTVDGQTIPVVTTTSDAPETAGNHDQVNTTLVNLTAERAFAQGNYVAHITATDAQGDQSEMNLPFTVAADPAQTTARYFASTKFYVVDEFKQYWEKHDGSKLFGDPISSQFIDEHGTTVQYFQRARFELGPNNSVSLGLLGDEALGSTQEKVPKPDDFNGLYFKSTGHTIAGKFKDFWQQNGGVEIFGYPISEVVDQNGTKVQYFERARFELAVGPNNTTMVELTPLGQQIWSSLNVPPAN